MTPEKITASQELARQSLHFEVARDEWIQERDTLRAENARLQEENAGLLASVERLRGALQAYWDLDEQVSKCMDDEDNGHAPEEAPESCGICFPFCDDARLKMRAALASTPEADLAALRAEAIAGVLRSLRKLIPEIGEQSDESSLLTAINAWAERIEERVHAVEPAAANERAEAAIAELQMAKKLLDESTDRLLDQQQRSAGLESALLGAKEELISKHGRKPVLDAVAAALASHSGALAAHDRAKDVEARMRADAEIASLRAALEAEQKRSAGLEAGLRRLTKGDDSFVAGSGGVTYQEFAENVLRDHAGALAAHDREKDAEVATLRARVGELERQLVRPEVKAVLEAELCGDDSALASLLAKARREGAAEALEAAAGNLRNCAESWKPHHAAISSGLLNGAKILLDTAAKLREAQTK